MPLLQGQMEAEMSESRAENDLRIDYIELNVKDVEAAKRFYGEAFGWEFTDYGPTYCEFRDGRMTGGFNAEREVTPGGPLVILYSIDLEAAEAAVQGAGGKIVEPIYSFPGGRRFHFSDPSGNVLAIWSDT